MSLSNCLKTCYVCAFRCGHLAVGVYIVVYSCWTVSLIHVLYFTVIFFFFFFFSFFFFFQAEDGIRDVAVTGVQTCALPI